MSVTRYTLENITGNEDLATPEYTLEYLVRTNDRLDGPATVINQMPWQYGDEYSVGNDYDPRAIAEKVTATPIKANPLAWMYRVEFGGGVANPLAEPPTIELIFAASETPFERDRNGKWVRNTIGDRFDDVLTKEDSQPVLRITRNEPASQFLFGVDLRDSINRSPWLGAARRTVKFQPPTARSRNHPIIGTYYEKSYEFKFSDDTWLFVLLNQGYYERRGNNRVRIKDDDGKDVVLPMPLTQAGLELPDGQNPVWLEFEGYRESDFPNFAGVSL